jgi:predicted nucleic acid-binding protein
MGPPEVRADAADTVDSRAGSAGRRATLERVGTPIGPNDLLIAAHALALGLPVVTNNEREFRRVPGLQIENWTR